MNISDFKPGMKCKIRANADTIWGNRSGQTGTVFTNPLTEDHPVFNIFVWVIFEPEKYFPFYPMDLELVDIPQELEYEVV